MRVLVCSNCRWWRPRDEDMPGGKEFGQCRRYAPKATIGPVAANDSDLFATWPITYIEDFCGDFDATDRDPDDDA